jgi:hypothetical protein
MESSDTAAGGGARVDSSDPPDMARKFAPTVTSGGPGPPARSVSPAVLRTAPRHPAGGTRGAVPASDPLTPRRAGDLGWGRQLVADAATTTGKGVERLEAEGPRQRVGLRYLELAGHPGLRHHG